MSVLRIAALWRTLGRVQAVLSTCYNRAMSWFLIALGGPLLYAISNHIDKLILEKYIRHAAEDMWVLTAFSACFSLVSLPVIALLEPAVFAVAPAAALELALIGALVVGSVLLYYFALRHDEASYVVPFYQTIPVMALALGYVFLGEVIPVGELSGGVLILIGALLLSFERGGATFRFKAAVVWPMLGASFLYALNSVLFKVLALDIGFWESAFWGYAGGGIAGIAVLACSGSVRTRFVQFITRNDPRGVAAASVSETFYVVAEALFHYASLLAPVALVVLVNAFQPVFVLTIGIFLTVFAPRLGTESLARRDLVQKAMAIALMVFGTLLIGE